MTKLLILLALASPTSHAERWDGNNNPANMDTYNYQFDQMPLSGGVDAAHTPWSDNYWESDWGGISLRWSSLTRNQLDPDMHEYEGIDRQALFQYVPPSLNQLKQMSREEIAKLSPAEKYDILMSRYDYPTVRSERYRVDPSIPNWQGLCHGWVAAAVNHPEPAPTDAMNAEGILIPFGSSDLKGLMTYNYGVTAYDFARGMDGAPSKKSSHLDVLNHPAFSTSMPSSEESFMSELDAMRPRPRFQNVVGQVGVHRKANDVNPGALHVVMANQLGLMHKAFLGNINLTPHPNEIWNQPISSYQSRIDYDKRGSRGGTVGVTTELTFVVEIAQNWEKVVGTPNQRFKTIAFSYDLDIDKHGEITGGRWRAGIHPNFLWNHHPIPVLGYFSKLNQIYHP